MAAASEILQPTPEAASALAWAHPVVAEWFLTKFGSPTEPQIEGWPAILAGETTLISAPTGSGKTLAAFLVAIDRLLRQSLVGALAPATQVIYVSPLKALSNDVQKNLDAPLREIQQLALARGYLCPEIRTAVRTGDTLPAERARMLRNPPHILVTTPESLYLLLTAAKSREHLRSVRTVIVDEIHAIADDKRGAHLALYARAAGRTGLRREPALTRSFLTGRADSAAAHRPLRHAKPDRARRPSSSPARNPAAPLAAKIVQVGQRGSWTSRSRSPPAGRHRLRTQLGHLARHVGSDLRPPRRACAGAPLHAGLRQHAPPGRKARLRTEHTPRRRSRRRPPRLALARAAPGRRAAPEERRGPHPGRHRVARARHRHRQRGPGLPDCQHARRRGRHAAHRPRRPLARSDPQGPTSSRPPATTCWNRPRWCARCAPANSTCWRSRRSRSTC